MTAEEKKCEHCQRLARGDVYCSECMLSITKRSNNEAKSDLKAKVLEILNSGDNTWACDCNDAGEIVGVIGLEWLKKRISEELA